MSKNLYTLVERGSNTLLGQPTFERSLARAQKQVLKQLGLDPVIQASKIDPQLNRIIR